MKVEGQSGFEFFFSWFSVELVKEVDNGGLKGLCIFKIVCGTDLGFDKLPKSFNQIEIWGIWRQKDEADIQS